MSDEALKQIAKDVAAIKAALAAGAVAFAAALGVKVTASGGAGGGDIANDQELDSAYGDPVVRKDPNKWREESYVGAKYSECTPDYLDAMAKYKDACAYANEKEGNPAKAKYIAYDRRDAARARGWAMRLRSGWKPSSGGAAPVSDEDYDDGADSDIPF